MAEGGETTKLQEPTVSSNVFDHEFQLCRSGLVDTIAAAKKTPHYQALKQLNEDKATASDEAFAQEVPILTSKEFQPPETFVADPRQAKLLYKEESGGSSGNTKVIYHSPEAMTVKIEEAELEDIKKADNPVIMHKGAETTSGHIIETTFKKINPKMAIATYLPSTDALPIVESHDLVYMTEQVSKMRELMNYFEREAATNPERIVKIFKDKQIFLELVAEPVDINEVEHWFNFLQKYTGKDPKIWAIYGTAETLKLGFWRYQPGNREIKYQVRAKEDGKYIEVVDEAGKLVQAGQEGRVIATPLRPVNYQGSVILRYDTGDIATVITDNADNVYLSNIRRNPEAGMMSIWGEKIFVPQIQSGLQRVLGFPISLKVVDGGVSFNAELEREQHGLTFEIYGDNLDTEEKRAKAQTALLQVVNNTYYPVPELIRDQKLVITTAANQSVPSDVIKAWKIERPKTNS